MNESRGEDAYLLLDHHWGLKEPSILNLFPIVEFDFDPVLKSDQLPDETVIDLPGTIQFIGNIEREQIALGR